MDDDGLATDHLTNLFGIGQGLQGGEIIPVDDREDLDGLELIGREIYETIVITVQSDGVPVVQQALGDLSNRETRIRREQANPLAQRVCRLALHVSCHDVILPHLPGVCQVDVSTFIVLVVSQHQH